MKTSANDLARLQNMIDGLEKLVLDSKATPYEFDSLEQAQTENAMRHIFAASAVRAKFALEASERGARDNSFSKSKRPIPLAVRLKELTAMLLTQPGLEPRLRAVFESSDDVGESEIDKVIEEVGKIISHQENLQNMTKSKKRKAHKTGD